MPCGNCEKPYLPDGEIGPQTPHAISGICCECAASFHDASWQECIPIYHVGDAVMAKLEEAGEWGYASAIRDALEADEQEEDFPETREAIRDALGALREHAQEFELADVAEEAIAYA